jgi:hypothetical protein
MSSVLVSTRRTCCSVRIVPDRELATRSLTTVRTDTKQAQGEGHLPIPIDSHHKFSPVRCVNHGKWLRPPSLNFLALQVALGDVARLCAYVLTSQGTLCTHHSDPARRRRVPARLTWIYQDRMV